MTSLFSSLLAISMILSFDISPSSGHLLTPQLPYWNIEKLPETPSRRPNQIINHLFRLDLPIILFESLDTDMLTVFDTLDKGIDFDIVNGKLVLKAVANKAFFKENISSSLILDSDFYSNSDYSDSN